MQITHARTDVPADSSNPSEIQPSDFTADHVLEDIASATDLAAVIAHIGNVTNLPGSAGGGVLTSNGDGSTTWAQPESVFVIGAQEFDATVLEDLLANPQDILVLPDGQYPAVQSVFVVVYGGTVPYVMGDALLFVSGPGFIADVGPILTRDIGGFPLAYRTTLAPVDNTLFDSNPVRLINDGNADISGGDYRLQVVVTYAAADIPGWTPPA